MKSLTHWRIGGMLILLVTAIGCNETTAPRFSEIRPQMTRTAEPHAYVLVSAGAFHNCALLGGTEAGRIACWGLNSTGEAPRSWTAAEGSFTQVSAGDSFTCAVRTDGEIQCLGNNFSGQAPALKQALSSHFVQVSAGFGHACALRADGVIECWGYNESGEAPASKSAAAGLTFTGVSAGTAFTCALRSDGAVECWGYNLEGQAPLVRTTSGSYIQVSAGGSHTCALRNDKIVECWGANQFSKAPATRGAAAGHTFEMLNAGNQHNCALRDDGVIECWGLNAEDQAPATRTAAVGTFVLLSAGAAHTCAVRSDGAMECWGRNDHGQAGPGSWHFAWDGFVGLDNSALALNPIRAGAEIKLQFSLGSDEGSNIFGLLPRIGVLDCSDPQAAPSGVVNATYGRKGLVYTPIRKNGAGNAYTLHLATNRAWAGSCRQVIITTLDGLIHKVNLRLT